MTRTRRSTHGPAVTGRDRSGRRGRSATAGTAAALAAAALLLTACGAEGDKDAGPQHVRTGAGPVQDDGGASKGTGTGGSKGGDADKGEKPSQGSSPDEGGSDSSSGTSGPDDGTSAGSDSSSGTSGGSGSTGSSGSGGTAQGGSSGEDAPSACRSSELKASVGANHPGAGQENFAVVLTNTSGGTCTVYGFPGLSFLDNGGTPVTADPERTGGAKMKITLSPGKSAWAPLSFSNPEMTGAKQVTPATVRITPPDQEAPLPIAWEGGPLSAEGTSGRAKIGPMALGTGG